MPEFPVVAGSEALANWGLLQPGQAGGTSLSSPQAEGNSKCKGPTLCPVPCPHPLPPGPPPALPLLSPGLQCPSPHQSCPPLVLSKHCGSKPGTNCPSLSGPLTTSIPARVKRAQAAFNPHCSQSDCHPHLSSSLTLSSSLYSPAPSVWCFLLFLVSLTYLLRFHTIQFTYFVFTNHWFLVYLQLCSHLCDLNLQHFDHAPKKPYTHQQSLFCFLSGFFSSRPFI